MQPYLTKSRFKLALECPTKLYYNTHAEYANQQLEDTFLLELAKGGFQVGALAQCYYAGGVLIGKGKHEVLFEETIQLLQQENCIIYEAAFLYQHCFIRADIVVKKGNSLELIEVKAKSFSPSVDSFIGAKGDVTNTWEPYLQDIAFQTWVVQKCLAEASMGAISVSSHLLLANKESFASVNALNQQFFYDRSKREIKVNEAVLNNSALLGEKVLIQLNVDAEVQMILEATYPEGSFTNRVDSFQKGLQTNTKLIASVGKKCKQCQFRNTATSSPNLLDGFKECWRNIAGFTENDFEKQMVWDLWKFAKADQFIANGTFFLHELDRADFAPKKEAAHINPGMSTTDRKELQVLKYKNKDHSPEVLISDLRAEMQNWIYPLHMIDFETSTVALPFYKGMRPYETVAFQFSHHIIHENGYVEHASEWLNTEKGFFPNFEFIRQLKNVLENDNGTIFRYATHENTVLGQIYRQLLVSRENDKEELMDFIKSITYYNKDGTKWVGHRDMVDLCETIRRYYYNPLTNGSNSIKKVLPAILESSTYLQEKYIKPLYGSKIMPSKNFSEFAWLQIIDGKIIDPYKLLPPIFSVNDDHLLDDILMDDTADIQNGGAAMAAYAMLQFSHISIGEATAIQQSLLKYCELDTLAMVMIWEELNNLTQKI